MTTFDLDRIFWSRPRVIKTARGLRRVRDWRIPEHSPFWDLWNAGGLREQGYTVKLRENGGWFLTEWREPESKPELPARIDGRFDLEDAWQRVARDVRDRYKLMEEYYRGYKEEIGDDFRYQLPAVRQLVLALLNFNGALDASDMGVGKTAVGCAVARVLARDLFVVSPKNVLPPWERMARQFKVQINAINYESLRRGNTEWGYWLQEAEVPGRKRKPLRKFIWQNLEPSNRLFIFDECHKMKDQSTLNCHIGVAAIDATFPVLALSATAAENPIHMKFVALLTRLIDHPGHFAGWLTQHGVRRGRFGLEFTGGYFEKRPFRFWNKERLQEAQDKIIKQIHHRVFPAHGARIRQADLGDIFPQTRVISEAYGLDNALKIEAVFRAMREEIAELKRRTKDYAKTKARQALILQAITKARQEIELLKVPLFKQMAEDSYAEGNRVAIAFNYDASVTALASRLEPQCHCLITGAVTGDARTENIDAFNADEAPYIILNTTAGGVGIGLHGRKGGCQRDALLSPTPSGVDLKQLVGRFPRANGALSIVRIVFAAGTFEERMKERAQERLRRISLFNDDALGPLDEALAMVPEERELILNSSEA